MSNPKPTADQIAEMATRGENISAYFTNKFTVVRPVHRVNVDLKTKTSKKGQPNFLLSCPRRRNAPSLALIGLSSSIEPLWGYPRATCRTDISSRERALRQGAAILTQSRTRWSPPPWIMPNRAFVAALAKAFLAGEPAVERVIARASRLLTKSPFAGSPRWLSPLARRFVKAFPPGKIRPRHRDVVEFLLKTPRFRRRRPAVENWLTDPPRMQPAAAAQAWPIPAIETSGALAEWLRVTIGELPWLADLKGLSHNYHLRALPKPGGAIRLIEAPKPRLKELQRKVLAEILERIPPHPAVHGFLKGHSIKTFVAPHVSERVVLKMDLEDFFPSISGPRVQALFRTMGYPEAVADMLGGVCTSIAPREFGIYSRPHLPQGAPTSPALANLCAYRVDCRLTGLARSVGAVYTRYADDLAFSGGEEFERRVERFSIHVAAILQEDGFSVNHRKTRIMRQSVRQHLAGLVANERLNIRRADFDRLKATLTNCIRLGPESQNRDAHPNFRLHLQGKVAFVESIHPDRGKRLRALFDQISC